MTNSDKLIDSFVEFINGLYYEGYAFEMTSEQFTFEFNAYLSQHA